MQYFIAPHQMLAFWFYHYESPKLTFPWKFEKIIWRHIYNLTLSSNSFAAWKWKSEDAFMNRCRMTAFNSILKTLCIWLQQKVSKAWGGLFAGQILWSLAKFYRKSTFLSWTTSLLNIGYQKNAEICEQRWSAGNLSLLLI